MDYKPGDRFGSDPEVVVDRWDAPLSAPPLTSGGPALSPSAPKLERPHLSRAGDRADEIAKRTGDRAYEIAKQVAPWEEYDWDRLSPQKRNDVFDASLIAAGVAAWRALDNGGPLAAVYVAAEDAFKSMCACWRVPRKT
ncbi:hypothetical protein ABZX38_32115 [Streptomyces longwoodensis]|uniref:hypothetical protein n=1 Tax=Streptomyces longwoodensis TaxID=68231 RepID=UPI0033A726F4